MTRTTTESILLLFLFILYIHDLKLRSMIMCFKCSWRKLKRKSRKVEVVWEYDAKRRAVLWKDSDGNESTGRKEDLREDGWIQ